MNKVKIPAKFFGPEVVTVDFSYDQPVNIFVNHFAPQQVDPQQTNILALLEPQAIRDACGYISLETIREHASRFLGVITYNDYLLNTCKNVYYWLHGHCSLEGMYSFPEKVFGISAVIGCKDATSGHLLRLQLYHNQQHIVIPKHFYISSRTPLKQNPKNNPSLGAHADDKMKLFSTMFHLCIENSVQKNYFTEKIIDCIRCKTIPIYYGCPNIGDFLDTSGIIQIDDCASDAVSVINSLTPEIYQKLLPAVERNYTLAEKYSNLPLSLHKKIEEILCQVKV